MHRWGQIACNDPVAAADQILVQVRTGQVEGAALSRLPGFGFGVLRVDAAQTNIHIRAKNSGRAAFMYFPRKNSTRYHQPCAHDVEAAVDGKAEIARYGTWRHIGGGIQKMLF